MASTGGERTTKDGRPTFGVFEHVYDLSCQLLGIYKSGALDEEIVWLGALPVGTIQGGVAYHIAPDHLGAPYKIVNPANAQVWFWNHDPFGNGAPAAAAGFSHSLRFPGQVHDAESGLHSNGQRDYDPRLGRYIESDPIGLEGGINTYAYAGSDPVNMIDPLGLDGESGVEQAFHDFFFDPRRYWSDLGRSVSADLSRLGAALDTCGVFCDPGAHASIGDAPVAMVFGGLGKAAKSGSELTRVGRWISKSEFNTMSSTGRVVEGAGGRTSVITPPNPSSYTAAPPGSVYAEFNVPTSILR